MRTRDLTPTALTAFTECPHSTVLDLACDARGEERPRATGAFFELITRKGNAHEDAYKQRLIDAEADLIEIPDMKHGVDAARDATVAAMQEGRQWIYQACLTLDGWRGAADFLKRVDVPTELGGWGYEPIDTKLARREALPHHVLQLAYYADAIAEVQGVLPERVHVELGSGVCESVRTAEIIHYARHQRRRFEQFVAAPTPTTAYPNAHCIVCAHRATCETAWRDEDHPSYVAGIRRSHVLDLAAADPAVTTLTGVAGLAADEHVRGVREETLAKLRRQAQLQRETIDTGAIAWEHLDRHPGAGFDLLPEPSPGDIYLDLEGDPVWRADRGLVFLFGWIEQDATGEWVYRQEWAHDEKGERASYERLVEIIRDRLAAHPGMHVYHYSHAETSMLSAISDVDADAQRAFEDLVASGVFVDLYKVVRQGLRVGLESYGLKRIERLAGYERTAEEVEGGSDAVVLYEQWIGEPDDALLERIAAYNADDCHATRAAHEWLQAHPPDGPILARDEYVPSQSRIDRDADFEKREALAIRLREERPDDEGARILATLLNYHEREERAKGRELAEMLTLPPIERLDHAKILTGLTPAGDAPDGRRILTWPEQEHRVEPGSVRDLDAPDERWLAVGDLDERARTLSIDVRGGVDPAALAPYRKFNPGSKPKAIEAIANAVLDGTGSFACARAIVARGLPLVNGVAGDVHVEQVVDPAGTADWLDAVAERALGLSGGPLSIQGPPGTGKSWLAAQIIMRLLEAGNTVAVTAQSHATIANLCEEIADTGLTADYPCVRLISDASDAVGLAAPFREVPGNEKAAKELAKGARLVAGTAWMCANEKIREAVDYLVIDEAGQFGLADGVASAACARKGVILVGDPLQLEQVAQARHVDEASGEDGGRSVLGHTLGDDDLIPPDRGTLLTITRRMHPDVCAFISENIYGGRLGTLPELANQNTAIGTGIRWIDVDHTGCSARSREEAEVVREQAAALIGTTWTDAKGVGHEVGPEDIMVVAPYNAQVRELRAELATDPKTDKIRVGTVDKFQGGEAPIVFFSMTTSSEDDLPRDKHFLFSRNRLNVALSRAQCVATIVANPALLDTRATTLDHLRLLSTFSAASRAGISPA